MKKMVFIGLIGVGDANLIYCAVQHGVAVKPLKTCARFLCKHLLTYHVAEMRAFY